MLHLFEVTPLRMSVLEGDVAALRRVAPDVAGAIHPEALDVPVVAVLAAPSHSGIHAPGFGGVTTVNTMSPFFPVFRSPESSFRSEPML